MGLADFEDDFISRTSSQLASRMVSSLHPFLKEQACKEDEVSLIKPIEHIFRCALRLKCEVMISGDTYQCIWPEPGSVFDERWMEMEQSDYTEQGGHQKAESLNVKLTLAPGISRSKRVHDARTIDYYGFKCAGEVDTELVRKALVLV